MAGDGNDNSPFVGDSGNGGILVEMQPPVFVPTDGIIDASKIDELLEEHRSGITQAEHDVEAYTDALAKTKYKLSLLRYGYTMLLKISESRIITDKPVEKVKEE